jgi:hypothetical protein
VNNANTSVILEQLDSPNGCHWGHPKNGSGIDDYIFIEQKNGMTEALCIADTWAECTGRGGFRVTRYSDYVRISLSNGAVFIADVDESDITGCVECSASNEKDEDNCGSCGGKGGSATVTEL